jgi:holo-[acyl-carrier protein] synthase
LVLYHGVDIIEVARIRRAIQRWGPRFLERIYTAAELADCNADSVAPRYESLAARWAAKEAAGKALGTGVNGLRVDPATRIAQVRPALRDIEVRRDREGRPVLHLHGPAQDHAARLGLRHLALSLSHTREYAVASVIGLGAVADSRQV